MDGILGDARSFELTGTKSNEMGIDDPVWHLRASAPGGVTGRLEVTLPSGVEVTMTVVAKSRDEAIRALLKAAQEMARLEYREDT